MKFISWINNLLHLYAYLCVIPQGNVRTVNILNNLTAIFKGDYSNKFRGHWSVTINNRSPSLAYKFYAGATDIRFEARGF